MEDQGGLKKYWKRRSVGYGRLYGSGRRRRMNRAKLGGEGRRKRRSWGIKLARKLRLILSPKKLLIRLRDAYVNLMLRLDNSSDIMMMNRGGLFGGGGCHDSSAFGFGKGPLKEYDEKMIVQMYKSLVLAQGLFVPADHAPASIRYPDC